MVRRQAFTREPVCQKATLARIAKGLLAGRNEWYYEHKSVFATGRRPA